MLKKLKSMPSEKTVSKIDLVVILILIFIGGYLFKNIRYFPVPESDFFQFLSDSWSYKELKLPKSLQSPPANPILIALFGNIINHPQSELSAAVSLNIIFFLASTFLIWLIGKKHLGIYALVLVSLFLTNPISYHIALNPSSEGLFTFYILLTLYIRQRGSKKLAYLLSGLSILVRYEGIALLGAQAISDFLFAKRKKYVLKLIIIGLLPTLLWLLVISKQNPANNISGNAFFEETMAQLHRLPNLSVFDMQPFFHFLKEKGIEISLKLSYAYLGFLLLGMIIAIKQRNREILIIFAYLIGFLTIHMFFPEDYDRYTYPVIWTIYFLGLWPIFFYVKKNKKSNTIGKKIVVLTILSLSFFLTITNIRIIKKYMKNNKYQKYENILLANWLNATKFSKDALIITLEPWIAEYYTTNKQVIFHRMGKSGVQDCDSLMCLIRNTEIDIQDKNIFFVTDSYAESKYLSYLWITNGLKIFKTFENSEDAKMCHLLITRKGHEKWIKIYQCSPPY